MSEWLAAEEFAIEIDDRGTILGTSVLGATALATSGRTNLVRNPSFEVTALKFWKAEDSTNGTDLGMTRVSDPASPSGGYRARSTTATANPFTITIIDATAQQWWHTIPIIGGRIYQFSIYTKALGSNRNARLRLSFSNQTTSWITYHESDKVTLTNATWQRLTITARAPRGAKYVYGAVVVDAGTSTTVGVDGAMIEEVPLLDEPVGTYFDGTSAGCVWTGVAHESASLNPNANTGKLRELAPYLLSASIKTSLGLSGAQLEPETSELSMRLTRDLSAFVGKPIRVSSRDRYGYGYVFDGVIDASSYSRTADTKSADGIATEYNLSAHGLEMLRLQSAIPGSRRWSTGGHSGDAEDFTVPFTGVTYGDLYTAITGNTYEKTIPSNPKLPADNDGMYGLYMPTGAGTKYQYACVYKLGHLLRGCGLDKTQMTNIDVGTQGELLRELAFLTGSRVTPDAKLVPRDKVYLHNYFDSSDLFSESGDIDEAAPGGFSIKQGDRQAVVSRSNKNWEEVEPSTAILALDSLYSNGFFSASDGTTGKDNVATRKLAWAAALQPVTDRSGMVPRTIKIDPYRQGSFMFSAGLPQAAQIDSTPETAADGLDVAVIGISHEITPTTWEVSLDIAPKWAITRENYVATGYEGNQITGVPGVYEITPPMPYIANLWQQDKYDALNVHLIVPPGTLVRAITAKQLFESTAELVPDSLGAVPITTSYWTPDPVTNRASLWFDYSYNLADVNHTFTVQIVVIDPLTGLTSAPIEIRTGTLT